MKPGWQVAALRHLLLDPGALHRTWRLVADAFNGGDGPPATADTGVTQERTACPSTMTVQAPQAAMPQPNLVPVSAASSRSAHSSGFSGGASSATGFWLREIHGHEVLRWATGCGRFCDCFQPISFY